MILGPLLSHLDLQVLLFSAFALNMEKSDPN